MEVDHYKSTTEFEDLPEEVVCKLLENLKAPQDMKNAWKTCNLWNILLDERRKEFLLPNILPFVHPYLSKVDIYNCRKVNKTWKGGVDNFLRTTNSRTFITSICDLDSFQRFRSVMRHSEASPFPSGKLMFGKFTRDNFIVEDEEAEAVRLYRMFPMLTSKYGEYVSQLIYCLESSCSVSAHQVQVIPKYLVNLKDLMLVEGLGGNVETEYIITVREIIENFPTQGLNMNNLRSFRCFVHNGGSIMKAILKQYGSQLERLHCFGNCLNPEMFKGNQLSNLKILKVFRCSFSLFRDNFSIISGLSLKVLKLEFTDSLLEGSQMVKLTNALPKSIINLIMRYPCDYGPEALLHKNFEGLQPCPNLKSLTISSEFLNEPTLLSKILMKLGGGVEHLKLSCHSYMVDFNRDFKINYVNAAVGSLFEKCHGLQSVEFQKPSRPKDFMYDSVIKIHRINRKTVRPGIGV